MPFLQQDNKKKEDKICIACGVKNKQTKKSYSRLMLLLLCLFFGYLELHKFYVGKIKSGFTLISSHSFFFYLTY
ncbi:conserved hypothetical protein (plasmid) [Borreliella burgdorferi 72a]|nr:conserved hypothetical protein [Borreliella burgdorferi 72a]